MSKRHHQPPEIVMRSDGVEIAGHVDEAPTASTSSEGIHCIHSHPQQFPMKPFVPSPPSTSHNTDNKTPCKQTIFTPPSAATSRKHKLQETLNNKTFPFSKRGKPLNSSQQIAILNVHQYFARECLNGGPLISLGAVQDRTADALGTSRRTVQHILSKTSNGNKISTPGKKRPYARKPLMEEVDDFMKSSIRRVIYDRFQVEENQQP